MKEELVKLIFQLGFKELHLGRIFFIFSLIEYAKTLVQKFFNILPLFVLCVVYIVKIRREFPKEEEN